MPILDFLIQEGLIEPAINGHVYDQPLITDGANFGHFSGSPRTGEFYM